MMWDKIDYPLPNFNGAAIEIWEWISSFIPYYLIGCYHLSMLWFKLFHACKRGPMAPSHDIVFGGPISIVAKGAL